MRNVPINTIKINGGVYTSFYNEHSGNWFVKMEDGSGNKYGPSDCPVRVPGSFRNEHECWEKAREWSKK